jgi:hypothetical protein
MAYEAEKFLKEHGDKAEPDKKAKVESCISELKEAVKANDTERMKKGLDELNSAMQAVSADMYAKAKQSGAQAGAPGAGCAAALRRRRGEEGGRRRDRRRLHHGGRREEEKEVRQFTKRSGECRVACKRRVSENRTTEKK